MARCSRRRRPPSRPGATTRRPPATAAAPSKVSGVISPLCSATGMKSSGPMKPRSGWSQRTSASAPSTAPSRSRTLGWTWIVRSPVRDGVLEVGEQRQPGRAHHLELGAVGLHAGTPVLGGVHRDVARAAARPGASTPPRTSGDADAGLDGDPQVVELERHGEGVPDQRHHRLRCRRRPASRATTANSSPPSRATEASDGARAAAARRPSAAGRRRSGARGCR